MESDHDVDTVEWDGREYLVLNDAEADAEVERRIESYIDECVLPEIPEHYQDYFDYEKFTRDARMDGRGHIISTYDGVEGEVKHEDEYYFIYRTN